MYQIKTKEFGKSNGLYHKIWLVMRLTTVILLASLLQVSASTFGQKITINERNAPLTSILKEIRKQSGYDFYYNSKDIPKSQMASVSVTNATLEDALKKALQGTALKYEIDGKIITVKKEENSLLADPTARFQQIDVRGKVVDSLGNGLAGATVSVKGGKGSTSTDAGGNFLINNVDDGAVLVVNYIGYVTKSVAASKEAMYVILKQSENKLDEIQVIAYGTTTRRLGTGNVNTVKAEDIAKAPVGNPLLAIAGRIPGVFIQQSSGVPGSGVKILIQGQNSIQNDNDPFFVVDGVPYVSQLLPGISNDLGTSGAGVGGTNVATAGNPLNFINPQDIESIDILKDADATAIYGSRAQNGAVIITTKKGKVGRTAVNFNFQQGFGEISKKIRMLNTEQYLEMRREAFRNAGLNVPDASIPIGQKTGANYDLTAYDQNKYTDWQKTLLGGVANYTNLMANITGGTPNIQYLFSGGYQNNGVVTPGNLKDEKASMHFNLNSLSTDKRFRFNFTGNYVSGANKLASVSSFVQKAFLLSPNAPDLYNENGDINWVYISPTKSIFDNPLAILNRAYSNKTTNLIANSLISYELIKDLNIKSNFGYNKLNSNEIAITPLTAFAPHIRAIAQRSSSFNTGEISTWSIEPQITLSRDFGPGKLEILVGTTFQEQKKDRQLITATGFSSDESLMNIKAATTVQVSPDPDGTILSTYRYNALFTRINYNVNNKYILNFSARRDGSSRFGSKNKFNNFGAIGTAWIFSEEDFVKNNVKFLTFGKLRASYGTTGNDQIGDYAYLNLYGLVGSEVPYQGITSLSPSERFPNPYLQWEETTKFSTTIDLGIFNDKILLSTTYYKNICGNQLVDYPLISSTGGRSVYQNRPVKVQNTGWEFQLNLKPVVKTNFTWSAGVNFTIPRNKLLKYEDIDQTVQQDRIGKSLQAIKVYKYLGVDPNSGLYLVEDRNGVATSNPGGDEDRTVFIDLNPKYYGGLHNSISYKGLSLDFLFQYAKQNALNLPFGITAPGAAANNQPVNVLDRWRENGQSSEVQMFTTSAGTYLNPRNAATQSDKAYGDASYLRLKNLAFSYSIPKEWLNKSKISSARIYMQGQNIFTITKFMGDPETKTLIGTMPTLRILTLGLQFEF